MLASMIVSTEQERAVKRLKVDSPSVSLECEDDSDRDSSGVPRIETVNPSSEDADRILSPPKHADASTTEAMDGVSPEQASLENSNGSCRDNDADSDGASEKHPEGELFPPPVAWQCTSDTWRVTRTSIGSSVKATSSIMGGTAPLVPPPTTSGSITTLRSLGQLQTLVSSTSVVAAKDKGHPSWRLKPGETVMFLLHFDDASLRSLINGTTMELSLMRIFTLNLAKLPPPDYETGPGKRLSAGGYTSIHDASDCVRSGGKSRMPDATATELTARKGEEGDEEEEEELVPSVHQMAVSTTAVADFNTISGREGPPRPPASAGGALALEDTASVSSLSDTLHHASDVISDRLHQMLALDTILNPHASQQQRGHGNSDGGSVSIGKKEPLIFPAMIVWRAAGAPREEYPPNPPQTYSTQPSSTPAELFSDRLSARGGPLVVKEATGVDQVHSLTLFHPVFTMEHLFRTLVRTVAPSFAAGGKSRTLLYLGASWCPPCMRFVHEMPQFMREDLPPNVVCTLKADMDLAKPIYDYLKVEIIPTFVILDNDVLMKCYEKMEHQQSSTAASSSVSASPSDYSCAIQDAFTEAELGRLQNSNRRLVSAFIFKHSQSLTFDEDF